METTEKTYSGDPCGMKGPCCDNPSVVSGKHECTESCEKFCEDSCELVCENCGGSCYHEI